MMKEELQHKINVKGDEIRALKAAGTAKTVLAPHIAELLALKSQLQTAVGGGGAPPA